MCDLCEVLEMAERVSDEAAANDAVAGQKSNNKSFGGTYLHTYICTIVNDYDETVLRLAPAGPAKSKKKHFY